MEQNSDNSHHADDTSPQKNEDKSLAESIGEALGHIWKAIKEPVVPPDAHSAESSDESGKPKNDKQSQDKVRQVVDREISETKRNGYTLRETTIREIEYDAPADEDTPQ